MMVIFAEYMLLEDAECLIPGIWLLYAIFFFFTILNIYMFSINFSLIDLKLIQRKHLLILTK